MVLGCLLLALLLLVLVGVVVRPLPSAMSDDVIARDREAMTHDWKYGILESWKAFCSERNIGHKNWIISIVSILFGN